MLSDFTLKVIRRLFRGQSAAARARSARSTCPALIGPDRSAAAADSRPPSPDWLELRAPARGDESARMCQEIAGVGERRAGRSLRARTVALKVARRKRRRRSSAAGRDKHPTRIGDKTGAADKTVGPVV
jgi:hypothetical protein